MNLFKVVICSICISSLCQSANVFASSSLHTFGLSIGKSTHSSKLFTPAYGISAFVERKLGEFISIGSSYTYFGEMNGPTNTSNKSYYSSTAKISSVNIEAIVRVTPINKIGLIGKLGYSQMIVAVDVQGNFNEKALDIGSRRDFKFGGGVDLMITNDVSLRTTLEVYLLGANKYLTLLSSGVIFSLD